MLGEKLECARALSIHACSSVLFPVSWAELVSDGALCTTVRFSRMFVNDVGSGNAINFSVKLISVIILLLRGLRRM